MTPLRSKPVVLLCLVLLASCWGCTRKKTLAAPPPPIAVPESTPEPQEAPSQTQTQLPAQGTPPPNPDQGQTTTAESPENAKSKNGKPHPPAKRPANSKTTETAHNIPPRTVVKPDAEPSPTPGQISPSPALGPHDQATTEQLLQTTENNLTAIKRQLSRAEEDTVTRIKDFVGQSRQAIKENDLVRAHNLALKAHLLCDDLIKRR